jgi:hypothetical protein
MGLVAGIERGVLRHLDHEASFMSSPRGKLQAHKGQDLGVSLPIMSSMVEYWLLAARRLLPAQMDRLSTVSIAAATTRRTGLARPVDSIVANGHQSEALIGMLCGAGPGRAKHRGAAAGLIVPPRRVADRPPPKVRQARYTACMARPGGARWP